MILAAWVIALALLVRRVYFRPQLERLAESVGRVVPGAVFFAVLRGDRQVGFASSTIDTTDGAVTVSDYFVADVPIGGQAHRQTRRTNVRLSRSLRMTDFDLSLEGDGPVVKTNGSVEGDSVLVLSTSTGSDSAKTQRIALTGPVFLPTLVPFAAAMIDRPKVGQRYLIPVFDPTRLAANTIRLDIRAESLVVVHDSATFDSTAGRWNGALQDTLRTWQLTADSSGGFAGWIDEKGRIVETSQQGFTFKRLPYEVAFVNWRNDSTKAAIKIDPRILQLRRAKR